MQKTRATQAALSRIIGCAESVISRAKKQPGFPEPDKQNEFEIKTVVVWWYLNKEGGGGRRDTSPTDDPMLAEGDSEGLERYRMARAQLEEIKLAELRGQVVMLDRLSETDRMILAPLRQLQETLKRRQDQETFQLVQDAIDQMEHSLRNAATNLTDKT